MGWRIAWPWRHRHQPRRPHVGGPGARSAQPADRPAVGRPLLTQLGTRAAAPGRRARHVPGVQGRRRHEARGRGTTSPIAVVADKIAGAAERFRRRRLLGQRRQGGGRRPAHTPCPAPASTATSACAEAGSKITTPAIVTMRQESRTTSYRWHIDERSTRTRTDCRTSDHRRTDGQARHRASQRRIGGRHRTRGADTPGPTYPAGGGRSPCVTSWPSVSSRATPRTYCPFKGDAEVITTSSPRAARPSTTRSGPTRSPTPRWARSSVTSRSIRQGGHHGRIAWWRCSVLSRVVLDGQASPGRPTCRRASPVRR